uniref:Reverse transcriptase domain-containing protein n=1 Tax=Tanacetum cinerariifolium TaxID=118510 RepID=A0A699HBW8_TANCI|nr:reverse transcriptase domain-containing protein [Tanacetum cinerariifolium]
MPHARRQGEEYVCILERLKASVTTTVAKILKAVTRVLAQEKHNFLMKNIITKKHPTEALPESEGSAGGHWKSKSKRQKSSIEEDDLSQPWVCEETNPFTPRIRYFDFPKTRMDSHIKKYDGSEYLEDHLKSSRQQKQNAGQCQHIVICSVLCL